MKKKSAGNPSNWHLLFFAKANESDEMGSSFSSLIPHQQQKKEAQKPAAFVSSTLDDCSESVREIMKAEWKKGRGRVWCKKTGNSIPAPYPPDL